MNDSTLALIGREASLFNQDLITHARQLREVIQNASFLVLGGAGTIGQAVVKEIFSRSPLKLHVVDISENNLVELVRDIRSSFGYIKGDFQTFALDIGSEEYDAYIRQNAGFDYVLNLSALKHVRSEKDPFTLMRMINTNVLNTNKTLTQSIEHGTSKYFCVSTDKAANPVNMMGASKRIMESFLYRYQNQINISSARFANVAFSDGSLLHGFNQRIKKRQPVVAPQDIRRYFVTPKESGELCLISCVFGHDLDIFFPILSQKSHLLSFAKIAERYLEQQGYVPFHCENEEEARQFFSSPSNTKDRYWPCVFSNSDTTGEKEYEEFFTQRELVNRESFSEIGIIKNNASYDEKNLVNFETELMKIKSQRTWNKKQLVALFQAVLPEFQHEEKGKYLDSKM